MNPFAWAALGQAGTAYVEGKQRLEDRQRKKKLEDQAYRANENEMERQKIAAVVAAEAANRALERHQLDKDKPLVEAHQLWTAKGIQAQENNDPDGYNEAIREMAAIAAKMSDITKKTLYQLPGEFSKRKRPLPSHEQIGEALTNATKYRQAGMTDAAIEAYLKSVGVSSSTQEVPGIAPPVIQPMPSPTLAAPPSLQMTAPTLGAGLARPTPLTGAELSPSMSPAGAGTPSTPPSRWGPAPATENQRWLDENRRQTTEDRKILTMAGVHRDNADAISKNVQRRLEHPITWPFVVDMAKATVDQRQAWHQEDFLARNPYATIADVPEMPENFGLQGATSEEFNIKAGQTNRRLDMDEAENKIDDAIAWAKVNMSKINAQTGQKNAATSRYSAETARIRVNKPPTPEKSKDYTLQLHKIAEGWGLATNILAIGKAQDEDGKWVKLTPEETTFFRTKANEAEFWYRTMGGELADLQKMHEPNAPEAKPSSSLPAPGTSEKIGGVRLTQPGRVIPSQSGVASRWVSEMLRKKGQHAADIRTLKKKYGYRDQQIYDLAHTRK